VCRSVRLLAGAVALTLAAVVVPAGASAALTRKAVVRAQKALNALGCDAGAADGTIEAHTRAGVIRFQAANRLNQSGRLTSATRTRLYAKRQVRCDSRPVVKSGTGRRVVISQRQNYVWLVGAKGKVLAQGPMADNPGVLSPGNYRVGSYCGRPARVRMNSDLGGKLWLPYFVRFASCGVGFHQVPLYKSTGKQIHPDWMLGTNMKQSHGCIRLGHRLAARVWDFAGVGTAVRVR
jgi:hypothetical protein